MPDWYGSSAPVDHGVASRDGGFATVAGNGRPTANAFLRDTNDQISRTVRAFFGERGP